MWGGIITGLVGTGAIAVQNMQKWLKELAQGEDPCQSSDITNDSDESDTDNSDDEKMQYASVLKFHPRHFDVLPVLARSMLRLQFYDACAPDEFLLAGKEMDEFMRSIRNKQVKGKLDALEILSLQRTYLNVVRHLQTMVEQAKIRYVKVPTEHCNQLSDDTAEEIVSKAEQRVREGRRNFGKIQKLVEEMENCLDFYSTR